MSLQRVFLWFSLLLFASHVWARPAAPITLTFVGDISLAAGVARTANAQGMPYLFSGLGKMLTKDDLTIGNLECAVAAKGVAADKQYTFLAKPSLLTGLRAGGVDAVTLANNHSLDFGGPALRETMTHLRRTGIAYAGAGDSQHDAERPQLLTVQGRTVALFGASRVLPRADWAAGAHHLGLAQAYQPAHLLKGIKSVRPGVSLIIVYLHWGEERETHMSELQRKLAHACIDAGADLVIGAHPHVLQGFEYYRGKLIAYSLGNFFLTNSASTALLQTTFNGHQLTRATVIPCATRRYRPLLISKPKIRQFIFTALQARSMGVRISSTGEITVAGKAPIGALHPPLASPR